jgi:hypothetical protein
MEFSQAAQFLKNSTHRLAVTLSGSRATSQATSSLRQLHDRKPTYFPFIYFIKVYSTPNPKVKLL